MSLTLTKIEDDNRNGWDCCMASPTNQLVLDKARGFKDIFELKGYVLHSSRESENEDTASQMEFVRLPRIDRENIRFALHSFSVRGSDVEDRLEEAFQHSVDCPSNVHYYEHEGRFCAYATTDAGDAMMRLARKADDQFIRDVTSRRDLQPGYVNPKEML